MVHISRGRIATSGTGVFGKGVVMLCEGQKVPHEDAVNGDKTTRS